MSGDIYNSKIVSKAQYRHSLRYHQQQGHSTISNELHDLLLQKDQTNFFFSYKSVNAKTVHQSFIVNQFRNFINRETTYFIEWTAYITINTTAKLSV